MTTDDTTPQQRLDANPELLEKVTDSMAHPERGVPRKPRVSDEEREPATVAVEDLVPAPSAYDVVPPELRPHRW